MSDVAVADVTVPIAPLLKTTVLLAGVVSKPAPLIMTVVALMGRVAVLLVTAGATEATCTAEPLRRAVGRDHRGQTAHRQMAGVENVTVSEFAVAAVTVPAACR